MIRSMTGFAAISKEADGHRVSVTAKSVNHRFLDLALKMPGALAAAESRVRAAVQQRLTRGRVEISVSVDLADAPTVVVSLNEAVLEQVAKAVDRARIRGLVEGPITVSDLLRLPQVMEVSSAQTDTGVPESALRLVEASVGDAIDALVVMRETEGAFLQRDLDARLAQMADLVDALERESADGQQALETRLRARLAELPADLAADPAAATQEIVRFIARSDIDEEVSRLRGHFAHWQALVAALEPCGRKLDFLVQEMNREINTIGSKAEGARAPERVVHAKAELERIKEQVQNVE